MTGDPSVVTAVIGAMPLSPRTRALVGRSSELDRVRRATGLGGESAALDPGAAVLLSGDAGIGTSRLVAELAAEARADGRLVVAGHCVGAGGDVRAWLPFVEVVAELARETPEVVAAVRTAQPALGALCPGTTTPAATDPGLVAEALHTLLGTVGREHPLLVVVEDVHWADHSSRDLLTLLLTRGSSAPVSLVVNYRSDDLHRRHPLHDVLAVWTRLPPG